MPTKKSVTVRAKVIHFLNRAHHLDPAAMSALIHNRVPCNNALASHPKIPVSKIHSDPDCYAVGALGLLNGLIQVLTGEDMRVAMKRNSQGEIEGFCAYAPDKAEPPARKKRRG